MSAVEVFSDVYEADLWNGGSGPGSAPENTVEYRDFLSGYLDVLRALTTDGRVVDLGCGDWRIGELVDWTGLEYVGVDVVPSVIEANQRRDTPDNVSFVCLDALTEELPGGDVLIVKDVFQHWPNADVESFLDTYCGRYDGIIVTNDIKSRRHPAKVNSDIELGGWRPIDVEKPPFSRRAVEHVRLDYPVLGEWVKRVVVI